MPFYRVVSKPHPGTRCFSRLENFDNEDDAKSCYNQRIGEGHTQALFFAGGWTFETAWSSKHNVSLVFTDYDTFLTLYP